MALPAIAPYAMPTEAEVPSNRASWLPEPGRAALLIHDMQHYFLDAFAANEPPVVDLLANIKRLRQRCDSFGIPVLYSVQPGAQTPSQRGLLQAFWGPGMGDAPRQTEIVPAVAPRPGEVMITKWRYSAFCKTALEQTLAELGRDQLIVCGIYAHIGCLATACDAFMRDVQPFLVADAVADFSPHYHHMALTYAAERCAVTLSTGGLLAAMTATRASAA